ncbi:replication-relaxation family protein [Thalassobacillus hwangdonensis]|uniref:Replication-relaxation family protein n=1 Tax=Thalassobacillus hwangdonensis TaxID=546108 RepID=A0ABW3KZK9_9BACI
MATTLTKQEKRILREEAIISKLDKLGFANRRQLQVLEDLGGDRNAHRILSEMESDRLLLSYRKEYKVYYVSTRGKERIGSTKATPSRTLMDHTLMRTDLYIELGQPADWRTEVPVNFGYDDKQYNLVPDAMYMQNGVYTFVEIDNTQTMRTNKDKIGVYAKLTKAIWQQYGHYPRVVFYTVSPTRKEKLERELERKGVKSEVFVKI